MNERTRIVPKPGSNEVVWKIPEYTEQSYVNINRETNDARSDEKHLRDSVILCRSLIFCC
jgi:hypothetical protein